MVTFGRVVRDGYLHVADARWNVVRRIHLTTGQQIIVAGNGLVSNGVERYNGDGIPARQAQLRSPVDVAIDSGGKLYIADFGNHRIRLVDKLDGTGTITTVAGWVSRATTATGSRRRRRSSRARRASTSIPRAISTSPTRGITASVG